MNGRRRLRALLSTCIALGLLAWFLVVRPGTHEWQAIGDRLATTLTLALLACLICGAISTYLFESKATVVLALLFILLAIKGEQQAIVAALRDSFHSADGIAHFVARFPIQVAGVVLIFAAALYELTRAARALRRLLAQSQEDKNGESA